MKKTHLKNRSSERETWSTDWWCRLTGINKKLWVLGQWKVVWEQGVGGIIDHAMKWVQCPEMSGCAAKCCYCRCLCNDAELKVTACGKSALGLCKSTACVICVFSTTATTTTCGIKNYCVIVRQARIIKRLPGVRQTHKAKVHAPFSSFGQVWLKCDGACTVDLHASCRSAGQSISISTGWIHRVGNKEISTRGPSRNTAAAAMRVHNIVCVVSTYQILKIIYISV